jgi:hypothetical protein
MRLADSATQHVSWDVISHVRRPPGQREGQRGSAGLSQRVFTCSPRLSTQEEVKVVGRDVESTVQTVARHSQQDFS